MTFAGLLEWMLVHFGVQAVALVRLLMREDKDPAVRIAWVVVVLAVPFLGVAVYFLFGEARVARSTLRRLRAGIARLPLAPPVVFPPAPVERVHQPAFARAAAVNGLQPTPGNRLNLTADSADTIDRLVADIDAATDHVHLSFYIWLDDETGQRIAEAVARAAERGVTCRCLADGLGSRQFIASPAWKRMGQAGAMLAVCFPFRWSALQILRSRIDIRNHRKMAIIDGTVAYVGSQNCCDAAFTVKAAFAPWVDIMARMTGPAVWQMQYLFLCDWLAHSSDRTAETTLAASLPSEAPDGAPAAVFGTGPELQRNAVTDVFQAVIAVAQSELEITTPYYVPDMALHQSILSAATRGVRVRMIVPARNDSRIVAHASRSFYKSLLHAGVELHEYRSGFLHAKTLVADGALVVLGSANMDRRSFDLNYENCIVVEDRRLASDIAARREIWLATSRRIGPEDVFNLSAADRITDNLFAIMAPLL